MTVVSTTQNPREEVVTSLSIDDGDHSQDAHLVWEKDKVSGVLL